LPSFALNANDTPLYPFIRNYTRVFQEKGCQSRTCDFYDTRQPVGYRLNDLKSHKVSDENFIKE